MSPLRILHLEDDRHDAELVEATLASGGLTAQITRVDSRDGFRKALESGGFDVILADYNLPLFDGLSAQLLTAELRPEPPFIFLSRSIGEELAVERLKAGATDYVLKDRMARLPSAVRRALAEAAERAERCRAEENVRQLNAELEQRVARRTAQLAESERRLKAILDHSPASISLKDLSGRYLVTNRQFQRVAGDSAPAGKRDADLFPPRLAAAYADNDARALDTPHGLAVEETFLQADGAHVHQSIKFPLLDDRQRPYALGAISIDITERKKTVDAVKLARLEAERANQAKSEFLSRISHELRTPLNAILGFAEVMKLDGLSEEDRESVQQIVRGGRHLLSLINEMLDISRIETGHLVLSSEPIQVAEVVQPAMELVRPLAQQRNVSLVVDRSLAASAVILADRQRLNQVLLNLLSNAVKYNRPDGTVTVGFERAGGCVRIVVSDTGIGISPDQLHRLFQPFERLGAGQTSVEGTGLGLALSRGLVEAMGGTIGVKSTADRGTRCGVELRLSVPYQPRTAIDSQDRLARPAAAPPHADGVVLYVEDNQSNVRLMERVLERRPGVRLVHAPTGEEGIRLARD